MENLYKRPLLSETLQILQTIDQNGGKVKAVRPIGPNLDVITHFQNGNKDFTVSVVKRGKGFVGNLVSNNEQNASKV